MKLRHTLLLIFSLLMLSSCDLTEKSRPRHGSILTPASSGNPYEVMVVCEDSVWNGYAGLAVQTILDKPLRGLPQDEEQFHKSHVTEKHYDRITNIFRNIIHIKISRAEYTKANITVEKDLHSAPQIILTVTGPNQFEVSTYITEHTKEIESLITADEINRAANDLVYEHNNPFERKVQEMFGVNLYIPTDINKMKIGDDFIWASNNGLNTIQNICIYSLPYVSEKMFEKRPYVALRDTIMKRNIPGGEPGSWMQTNGDYVWTKIINVNGEFCMEARGLWEMRNDDMGGPFVSHSRVDKKNNRVIVVEGFVYAPQKMKRTMIRRLEAALYTLEIPE